MYQNRFLQEKGTISKSFQQTVGPHLYPSWRRDKGAKCTSHRKKRGFQNVLRNAKSSPYVCSQSIDIITIDFLPSKNNQQIEARKNA